MDEQSFLYEDSDEMTINRDNMQQSTHMDVSNIAKDAALSSINVELENHLRTSKVCVNEYGLETSSLDVARVGNATKKGQNDDTITERDKITSQSVLDASNVDNMRNSYSTNIVSNRSSAAVLNLANKNSKGIQASNCENNSTEESQTEIEQQASPFDQVTGSEQVTEIHHGASFFVGDQGEERADENQERQKTTASSEDGETIKITGAGLNQSMCSLTPQPFEVNPAYTPSFTSVQIGCEEDIDSDPSDCYIQQETEIINPLSTKTTNFEPVILNVCGGYHEMENDDINENQNLTSFESTKKSQILGDSTIKNSDTESIKAPDLVSKSASELLQGMIQYAVSTSQNPKEASSKGIISLKIRKRKTCPGTKISNANHPLVLIETPIATDQGNNPGRQATSLVANISPLTETVWSTKSMMLSRVADKSPSDRGFIHIPAKVPQSTILKTSALGVISSPVSSESAPDGSSQLLPNILVNPTQTTGLPTTYSCVYVQDPNNGHQNKVAFLVPQASFKPDMNYLANIASSVLPKTPVPELQTTVTSAFSSSIASCAEVCNKNSKSVMERISKLVTKTMDSFYLQGNDLKGSDLLTVFGLPKKESSPDAVSCSICEESYYDKEGLNVHLKRTVFHLLYYCSYCKCKLSFYNKCSLWMHLRSENPKYTINYNNIIWLKPYDFDADDSNENEMSETVEIASPETSRAVHYNLDVSRGNSLPPRTTASIEEVRDTEFSCNTSVSLLPRKGKCVSNTTQCPICKQYFPDLKAHLCPSSARAFPCSSCDMFLPSICAHAAHLKIHQGAAKEICCPECGEKGFKIAPGDDDMRCVFDHVDACKHFNRIINIECFCTQKFNKLDSLVVHFIENHFRTIFKCPLCVFAFTQHENFVQHAEVIHKIKASIGASVVCACCQNVLKFHSELKVHLDQHVKLLKKKATFNWKCFICTKTFTDKAELNKHTECDHPHKSKRCTICYSLFWSRKSLVEHIVEKKCLRSLAKKLNYCVDMQADELEQTAKSVHLSKLFEVNQSSHDIDKTQRQIISTPVVSKNPVLVKIAPKVVPKSVQLVPNLQSQPKPRQMIQSPQSAVLQKQILTRALATGNKLLTQACKIIITSKANSTSLTQRITVSQCVVCKQIIESIKMTEHLKFHQSQGVIICFHCLKRDFTTLEEVRKHSEQCGCSVLEQAEKPAELRSDISQGEDNTPEANSESRESCGIPLVQQRMETGRESSGVPPSQQRMETGRVTSGVPPVPQRMEIGGVSSGVPPVQQRMEIGGVSSGVPSVQQCMETGRVSSGMPPVQQRMETGGVSSGVPPVQQCMETDDNSENQTLSVFPCLLCGLAFQSLSAKEEHVSRSHDGIRVVYHCRLCRKKGKTIIFSRKEMVSRHIIKKHRIGNMDTVNRLIQTEEQNASSGQKVHTSRSVEVSAPKRLRLAGEGDYMCGKCGFSSSKSEEFSQHIVSHNSNKEPQCPECGLCFTVFFALKKHLLAVHKIQAVDDYLKKNNVNEPELDEEFEFPEIHPYNKPQPKLLDPGRDKPNTSVKVASANPLQCTVCYKSFDVEANLKTHMRNHGMAFIRSKRHKV